VTGGWWWVSPHPDDAVFSSVSALWRARRAGQRVGIVTVFGTDPARLAEEDAAAAGLGVKVVRLGLADAPARRGARTARDLLVDLAVREDEVVAVAAAVRALAPARVFLPLAVGGHIDHRTVAAIWTRIGCELRFYEDRPYADVPGLVAARLGRGGDPSALAEAPWFTAHVAPEERAALAAAVVGADHGPLPTLLPDVVPAAPEAVVRAAWAAFRSQQVFAPRDARDEVLWRPSG
jgi:LmbE family N-acetylglucosaminyl deacetylase